METSLLLGAATAGAGSASFIRPPLPCMDVLLLRGISVHGRACAEARDSAEEDDSLRRAGLINNPNDIVERKWE